MRSFVSIFAVLVMTVMPSFVQARDHGFRKRHQVTATVELPAAPAPADCGCNKPASTTTTNATTAPVPATAPVSAAGDGLDEVNALRIRRGLHPFQRDESLTRGAIAVASFRAERRLFGHTSNDFVFLPPGTTATAGGCAAYPASYGWMSCCVYDRGTSAGAAWVTGADGKRYMHLFVR